MPLYLGKTPMNGVISPQLGSQAIDSEVNIQAQKIAELSSILDGKAAGSGVPQMIEITLKRKYADNTDPAYIVYFSVVNGNKILTDYDWGEGEYTFTCCVGDAIYIRDTNSDLDAPAASNNLSICDIRDESGLNWLSEYWIIPNGGTTGTITM